MLVAAFVIHLDDPYAKKEMALLYLFGYLTLYFMSKPETEDYDDFDS